MAGITYNAIILIKSGTGSPGISLDLAEPAYDASNNLLYIGQGIGQPPVIFYPNVSTGGGGGVVSPFDILQGGKSWDVVNTDLFDAGNDKGWGFVNIDVLIGGVY